MKKKLLIAGGTGLIGTALQNAAVLKDWELTILSRQPGPGHIVWDPQKRSILLDGHQSYDAIINLAGTSIAGSKWTDERKKDIRESRINASRTLEKYLSDGKLKTSLYVGVSAVGIYGDSGLDPVDEETTIQASGDWMAETVVQWEAGHKRIEALGIRTVILRIGLVLTPKGGALKEILQTAPFGFLTYFGKGQQIWPWIHMDDLIRIFQFSLEQENAHGTYLASAPHPVSNKELANAAAKQYSPHRIVMSAPEFALALMLGEMRQMLFQSCNGNPKRLLKEGFIFRFKTIDEAMADLIRQ
jgi:uncharacterized protein